MGPDPSRLEELERAFQRLSHDLAEARRELDLLRASTSSGAAPSAAPHVDSAPPPPPRPKAPPRRPPAPRTGPSAEQLIGRYGALGVGVLMVVLGAGALVSWAVAHNLLGPWVRVTLGLMLSIAFAVAGWRLRARSRGFGNALLGLALAVLHVVAWGAGPRLGLVPAWFSLAIADVASVALAALALKEGEQTLFAVGLGGALLAPFVMATGVARYGVLAVYGLIVLGTGIRTIGERAWWLAVGLVVLFTFVYTGAAAGFTSDAYPWLAREFPGAFAAGIALIALFGERRPARPWMGAAATFAMAIALFSHRAAFGSVVRLSFPEMHADVPVMAFAGAVITLAVVRDFRESEQFPWLIGVAVLPSLLLVRALSVTRNLDPLIPATLMIVAWAALYIAASRFETGNRRGVLLALSGIASLGAVASALRDMPDILPIAMAAHAILYAWIAAREQQTVTLVSSAISVFFAFIVPLAEIATAHGFTNAPFLSMQSVGVASAVFAGYASARVGLAPRVKIGQTERSREVIGMGIAATLAFIWGWVELGHAFSADASTFLRIVYLAVCGVGSISVGRRQAMAGLRQIGLGLSLLAAFRAVVQASTVANVALQVGSYLGAGLFLLGVAWLYRKGQGDDRTGVPPDDAKATTGG